MLSFIMQTALYHAQFVVMHSMNFHLALIACCTMVLKLYAHHDIMLFL
uniref:Uncharacterized protein n=1 Tax=Rhizophora mucronata TaxID=61149 RepID=A0A2P2PWZ0_RHIMU